MSELELPKGWVKVPLAEIATSQLGKMLDKAKRTEGTPLPYLRNVNVRWDKFDLSNLLEMPFTESELERYGLRDGDVLICEGGEPGRAAIWRGGNTSIKYQKALHRVRLEEGCDPRWLVFQLRKEATENRLSAFFTGTTIKHFTGEALSRYPIFLPPLPEQHRIVEKIEALTARSRRARQALDSLPVLIDRYRQSVLAAALCGNLTEKWRQNKDLPPVPDEYFHPKLQRKGSRVTLGEQRTAETDRANMPDSWKKVMVRDVARLQPGYAFKSSWFAKSGVRLLRGTNIAPDGTRWDDVAFLSEDRSSDFPEYQLNDGDIVIAMDRPFISSGLKVARITQNELPALLLQRVGRFHLSKAINPDFFWSYLHSSQFIRHILGQATGSDLPHISAADIESAPLYVPPIDEQREIIKKIGQDELVGTISIAINFARDRLATLDQSILAKAFRGELVPQDPDDELASTLLERIRAERAAAGAPSRRGRRART